MRHRRGDGRIVREARVTGTRKNIRRGPENQSESPLRWLRCRKDRNGRPLIDNAQFEAGERLRADYEFAQLGPRVTANWSCSVRRSRAGRGATASADDVAIAILDAKARVSRALTSVGPEISGVLVDICCERKGLEDAEKENGWPQRAGKVVLQIALTRLARHYGLIADTTHPRHGPTSRDDGGAAPGRDDITGGLLRSRI